ncbi:MAG: ABC transporter ATP-binding protein [Longimicrobiales bacterium]|nr:ABC transporter ATP-binding protein [Longimicrobiales bacterium]
MSKPKKKISGASLRNAFEEIIWPRKNLIGIGLILIVMNRLSGLALPLVSRYIIDGPTTGDTDRLPFYLSIVAGAIAIQASTSYAMTMLLSVEAQNLIANLRSQVQKHVLQLPVRVHDNTKTGELVSRIMDDVEGVRNLVGTGLVQLVGGTITTIVAFVFLMRTNVAMTGLALVPLAAFGFVSIRAFQTLRPAFRERGKIRAEVIGRLTEALGGIRIIKGFHAVDKEGDIFLEGVMKIFANVKTTLTTSSLVTSLGTFFIGMASVLILGYGSLLIGQDLLTAGELISFILLLGFLIAPVLQMANIGTQMTEAFAGLDRTAEVLGWPQEDDDPERTVTMPAITGHLVFEDVRFRYDDDKPVLHGVSFEATPGMVVALVGSSGSGKSTMAGLAATFLTPDSGRVVMDGVDLRTVNLASYRKQLGLVFQDDFLFDGTIRDNLRFASPEATDAEIDDAAEKAYIREFSDRFPDGLETIIGERGVKLSGGQRQRVTIARALLADPRVLLLDEATSSLDTESEALIQASLDDLLRDRTTIVIAHRLTTIQRADLILVLEGGEVVERGKHDDLMTAEGRYHQLYTVQARI